MTLIVGVERALLGEQARQISEQLREALPSSVGVVVIPGCTSLAVIPSEPLEVRL